MKTEVTALSTGTGLGNYLGGEAYELASAHSKELIAAVLDWRDAAD